MTLSTPLSHREINCRTANRIAAIKTKKIAGWNTPKPGLITISIPIKPVSTASHLRKPTGSFNTSAPSIVTIKGATKLTAIASASGTKPIAAIKNVAEPNRQLPGQAIASKQFAEGGNRPLVVLPTHQRLKMRKSQEPSELCQECYC